MSVSMNRPEGSVAPVESANSAISWGPIIGGAVAATYVVLPLEKVFVRNKRSPLLENFRMSEKVPTQMSRLTSIARLHPSPTNRLNSSNPFRSYLYKLSDAT